MLTQPLNFPLPMWTAAFDMQQGMFSQTHVSRVLWCTTIYHVVDISCPWDRGVDLWETSDESVFLSPYKERSLGLHSGEFG